jgi:hypothetical protein
MVAFYNLTQIRRNGLKRREEGEYPNWKCLQFLNTKREGREGQIKKKLRDEKIQINPSRDTRFFDESYCGKLRVTFSTDEV